MREAWIRCCQLRFKLIWYARGVVLTVHRALRREKKKSLYLHCEMDIYMQVWDSNVRDVRKRCHKLVDRHEGRRSVQIRQEGDKGCEEREVNGRAKVQKKPFQNRADNALLIFYGIYEDSCLTCPCLFLKGGCECVSMWEWCGVVWCGCVGLASKVNLQGKQAWNGTRWMGPRKWPPKDRKKEGTKDTKNKNQVTLLIKFARCVEKRTNQKQVSKSKGRRSLVRIEGGRLPLSQTVRHN